MARRSAPGVTRLSLLKAFNVATDRYTFRTSVEPSTVPRTTVGTWTGEKTPHSTSTFSTNTLHLPTRNVGLRISYYKTTQRHSENAIQPS